MQLLRLHLNNFRNYQELIIEFSPWINLFFGQNAQGKTNLLEAIYLLAFGRSFRTHNDQDLIRYGCQGFRVEGLFSGENGVKSVLEYTYLPPGKDIRQNGIALKRAQDLFGRVNAVLFSPDDLQLLKGGPEYRRNYLDFHLAQAEPRFRRIFYTYQRVLYHRNELLRRLKEREVREEEFSAWEATFLNAALEVVKWRLQAIKELAPLITTYHARLSGEKEEIVLTYVLGGKVPLTEEDEVPAILQEEIKKHLKEEIIRGITLFGPHRDEIIIGFRTGQALRLFASQGQQRTAALAMKLAAVDYLTSKLGEPPLLLLDDVFSELDEERRNFLLSVLLPGRQSFITSTEKKDFGSVGDKVRFFLVTAGQIEEEEK